jgi:hypothetical protein
MVVSPDKQSIYLVAGNHVDVPEMNAYRLPRVWDEDNVFTLIKDPRGHANSRMAPGGWIAKIDPEGQNWELISAGFRNAYDIAFNEAGDFSPMILTWNGISACLGTDPPEFAM